jgi:hypothetical protein
MKIEHGVKILFSISMVLLIGVFSGACIASAGLDCECVKKVDCKKGTELDIQERIPSGFLYPVSQLAPIWQINYL